MYELLKRPSPFDSNINPLVFLDIDGVLNTQYTRGLPEDRTIWYSRGDGVEISKLNRLKRFVEDIDARIIMVSSWFWSDPTPEQRKENLAMIEFLGLRDWTIGVSHHTGGGLGRGKAILSIVDNLDVTNWVVVDDAGDNMYDYDVHVIDGKVGLTDEDVRSLKFRLDVGMH